MLFSYSVVAVDPISLWQLTQFCCGSWRIFIVAVGAFSLWQLANISYNCQYLHNTTIDGAKLQNRLYRIMVIIITKKTPENQD